MPQLWFTSHLCSRQHTSSDPTATLQLSSTRQHTIGAHHLSNQAIRPHLYGVAGERASLLPDLRRVACGFAAAQPAPTASAACMPLWDALVRSLLLIPFDLYCKVLTALAERMKVCRLSVVCNQPAAAGDWTQQSSLSDHTCLCSISAKSFIRLPPASGYFQQAHGTAVALHLAEGLPRELLGQLLEGDIAEHIFLQHQVLLQGKPLSAASRLQAEQPSAAPPARPLGKGFVRAVPEAGALQPENIVTVSLISCMHPVMHVGPSLGHQLPCPCMHNYHAPACSQSPQTDPV